jgi:hypothetical protein
MTTTNPQTQGIYGPVPQAQTGQPQSFNPKKSIRIFPLLLVLCLFAIPSVGQSQPATATLHVFRTGHTLLTGTMLAPQLFVDDKSFGEFHLNHELVVPVTPGQRPFQVPAEEAKLELQMRVRDGGDGK